MYLHWGHCLDGRYQANGRSSAPVKCVRLSASSDTVILDRAMPGEPWRPPYVQLDLILLRKASALVRGFRFQDYSFAQ